MAQASEVLKQFVTLSWNMLEVHCFQDTVLMGLQWLMHSTLVGNCLWLSFYIFTNAICLVFSNVNTVGNRQPLSVEGSNVEKALRAAQQDFKTGKARSVDSSLPQCVKLEVSERLALHSDGDVVIGGFFPLHYVAAQPQNSYNNKPQMTSCSG